MRGRFWRRGEQSSRSCSLPLLSDLIDSSLGLFIFIIPKAWPVLLTRAILYQSNPPGTILDTSRRYFFFTYQVYGNIAASVDALFAPSFELAPYDVRRFKRV